MTAPDHIQQQKISRITDEVKRTFFTVSNELAQLQWGLARWPAMASWAPTATITSKPTLSTPSEK